MTFLVKAIAFSKSSVETSICLFLTYSVEGSNGACSSIVNITIEIDNASVSADFSLDTTTVCVGDVLGVNGSSSNGAQTYSWTFNSGTPGIGSGAISSTVYNTPGSYRIDLEVENACNHVIM